MKLQLSLIIKQKEKHYHVCLVSFKHEIYFLSKIHNVSFNTSKHQYFVVFGPESWELSTLVLASPLQNERSLERVLSLKIRILPLERMQAKLMKSTSSSADFILPWNFGSNW